MLVALMFLNLWFFIYKNTNGTAGFGTYARIYNETVDEMSSVSWEEGIEYCESYDSFAQSLIFAGEWDGSIESAYKWDVIKEINKQFTHLIGYGKYVSGIDAEAKKLQFVSLFAKPGTFAYENTVKTAKDFSKVQDTVVEFGHDRAVAEVFGDEWSDIIVMLPIFLICGLFLADRKDGLNTLIHSWRKNEACLKTGRSAAHCIFCKRIRACR